MIAMITDIVAKYAQPLFDRMSAREFKKFMAIALATVLLLVGLMTFWHYRNLNSLVYQIERTNEERELRDFKKSRAIAIMKQIKDEKGFVDYQEWLKEAGMEKISDVIVDDAIEQLFIMNPENFIEINKWQKYQYTGK